MRNGNVKDDLVRLPGLSLNIGGYVAVENNQVLASAPFLRHENMARRFHGLTGESIGIKERHLCVPYLWLTLF